MRQDSEPIVKKWLQPGTCCWCATPKTGTYIIGYLSVIGSLMSLLCTIRGLFSEKETFIGDCHDRVPDVDCENLFNHLMKFLGVMTAAFAISAAFSIMLLVGVNKNKPSLMLPHLILHGTELVGRLILMLVLVVVVGHYWSWLAGLITFVIVSVFFLLGVHLFLVTNVCYLEIKRQAQAPSTVEVDVGKSQTCGGASLPAYENFS